MLLSRFDLVFYQSTAISLDILKMTEKSCVTFVKVRWRINFTLSVCVRYIRMQCLSDKIYWSWYAQEKYFHTTVFLQFRRKMLEACCICFLRLQIKTTIPRTTVKCINHSPLMHIPSQTITVGLAVNTLWLVRFDVTVHFSCCHQLVLNFWAHGHVFIPFS